MMGILTDDMQQVVREQRLGFAATVCPDGTPNLSPKGTTKVYDDNHLIFADIHSPTTVENCGFPSTPRCCVARATPVNAPNRSDCPVTRLGNETIAGSVAISDGPEP